MIVNDQPKKRVKIDAYWIFFYVSVQCKRGLKRFPTVVATNCSKIHTSRGQRRYRNSFRPLTFSRGPLLPGFSPHLGDGPASITICATIVPVRNVCQDPSCARLSRAARDKTQPRSIFEGAFPRMTLSRYSFLFPIAVKFGGMSGPSWFLLSVILLLSF